MRAAIHPCGVVAHGGLVVEVDPQRAEDARQVSGICIDDLAEQELGADGQDFGFHRELSAIGQ